MFAIFDVLNNSNYFSGLIMILLNFGSKYIAMEVSPSQESFMSNIIIRRLLLLSNKSHINHNSHRQITLIQDLMFRHGIKLISCNDSLGEYSHNNRNQITTITSECILILLSVKGFY